MEKGFDVFISFKNTDKNGERTQDSFMAEELYEALKEKGINAFYSNKSISERGEHRFGKMIREAIEQCSIFIAVGTCIENFESEWVEYERESFHDEMMNGNKARTRSAMFSYITRNVATNKLPMELRRCQAFYELKDVVSSVCTRFQKEHEVIHNFEPQKISIESLSPGTLVDGKYKIVNKVGQGGMSVVYLAMDIHLNKLWAVKVVRKEGVRNFEVVKQSLLAEVEMLKTFDHPNLPRIIDVIDAKESFVIIMDFIEGSSLNKLIEEEGAQPEKLVINWAKQLCDVLNYLHTHNPPIIYRDLKPANIMLKPNGQLALIDFGTARQYKEYNLADTTCLGTMGYAAPEQFGGMGQTDQRTDIYTLGVTLHHLVTGHNPTHPPYELFPIREINPLLSYGLEAIIDKCVHRNPEDRYQSVLEIRNDLDNIDRIDSKRRRKGLLKKILKKIFGTNEKNKNKVSGCGEEAKVVSPVVKPIVIPPSVKKDSITDESIILPSNDTMQNSTVVKKSTVVNENTVILCDKVAICVSTKSKLVVGDQVNVYFATEASRSDIAKLITSNPGYTKVVAGDKIVDINHNDLVQIRLASGDVVFNSNEFEFLWADYTNQRFYEYFSFQVVDIPNQDSIDLSLELYINRKIELTVKLEF